MAAALLGASQTWAQTDVTSTYITNAGFDTSSDWVTGNISNTAATSASNVTGWTQKGADSWTYGGSLQFGGSGTINNASIPTTNSDGQASGGALALSGAWDGGNGWIAYTQDVTLPAGNYVLTIPVNNVGKNDKMKTDNAAQSPNLFNFTTNDNVYSGTVTSFPVDTWTTNTIRFSLASETSGTLSLGLRWVDTGSGNTPKLVIDYVKAMYTNYTETLQSTIDRATILNARASDTDLANAITTAQDVLNGADNTVAYQATIDNAVTTLRSAISTAAAKVVLLEGENITFMFENADFESSTPVTGGITTYDYDAAANSTSFSRMQVVEGWTIVANGNAKSAGIYEFGQNPFLGSTGASYQAPSSGSSTDETKALGIVAVWSSSAQYKQNCTLPAGSYIIEVPVYNTAGTTAFSKNLIGFVENGGTEHLATAKTYATGSWITEKVIFELKNETAGYLSLGYTAANQGSNAMPHLFIDGVKITYTSPIAAAYQRYQNALEAANAAIANDAYTNVTGSERTDLQSAINATPTATKEGYNDAADDLDTARKAFTGAKANYDAFVAAKATIVLDLAYAATAKKTALTDAIAATASNSEDAATKAAAITTALRAYYESHALAEGVNEAVDYNSAVADANAETNTGWTNGVGTKSGEGYTDSEGNVASKYLDGGWASSAACNIDMTRSIEIPAGRYLLTVKARGAQDLTVYTLSIAGETINLPHANGGSNGVFGNGWEDASIEFESDGTAQTLEVIAQSTANQQWFSMNDFRLVQLEANNDAYAGAAEYAALNTAIEAAEAKTLGFDNGEYAPYNNVEALTALAAAKAIDQTAVQTNLKTVVEGLTTALGNWTANATEVNAFYDGNFTIQPEHTTGPTALTGWNNPQGIRQLIKNTETYPGLTSATGKAAVFAWGNTTMTYGDTEGYTMPLAAHTIYEFSFKTCGWIDGDMGYVNVDIKNASNEGLQTVATAEATKRISEENPWVEFKVFFETGEAGNYKLDMWTSKHTTFTDLVLKKVVPDVTINDNDNYTPVAAEDQIVVLKRSYNAGKWNTFCVPFNISKEELKAAYGNDVAVATYTEDTTNPDRIGFNSMTDPSITANVPVLLKPITAPQANIVFTNRTIQTGEAKVEGTNFDFVGNYSIFNEENGYLPAGNYFISNNTFYKATESSKSSLKSTRAYIAPKSSESRLVSILIDNVETTGINGITNDAAQDGKVYNLSGQQVNKVTKGIFVKNGKKYIVK